MPPPSPSLSLARKHFDFSGDSSGGGKMFAFNFNANFALIAGVTVAVALLKQIITRSSSKMRNYSIILAIHTTADFCSIVVFYFASTVSRRLYWRLCLRSRFTLKSFQLCVARDSFYFMVPIGWHRWLFTPLSARIATSAALTILVHIDLTLLPLGKLFI